MKRYDFAPVMKPEDCDHNQGHVCEHGLIDHCRHGAIFCGYCGKNLTEQMEMDLIRDLRQGAKTNDA